LSNSNSNGEHLNLNLKSSSSEEHSGLAQPEKAQEPKTGPGADVPKPDEIIPSQDLDPPIAPDSDAVGNGDAEFQIEGAEGSVPARFQEEEGQGEAAEAGFELSREQDDEGKSTNEPGPEEVPTSAPDTQEEESSGESINKSEDSIPSFSEWTQLQLSQRKEAIINNIKNKTSLQEGKNFASPDCGAKVVNSNPEAQNPSGVISSSHDEYMLNRYAM
jgi:hypothetical protein